jgi:hypothetical protein
MEGGSSVEHFCIAVSSDRDLKSHPNRIVLFCTVHFSTECCELQCLDKVQQLIIAVRCIETVQVA